MYLDFLCCLFCHDITALVARAQNSLLTYYGVYHCVYHVPPVVCVV